MEGRILVDTHELMKLTGMGRRGAERLGDAAGARVWIGKILRWNVERVKTYLDTVSNNEQEE